MSPWDCPCPESYVTKVHKSSVFRVRLASSGSQRAGAQGTGRGGGARCVHPRVSSAFYEKACQWGRQSARVFAVLPSSPLAAIRSDASGHASIRTRLGAVVPRCMVKSALGLQPRGRPWWSCRRTQSPERGLSCLKMTFAMGVSSADDRGGNPLKPFASGRGGRLPQKSRHPASGRVRRFAASRAWSRPVSAPSPPSPSVARPFPAPAGTAARRTA